MLVEGMLGKYIDINLATKPHHPLKPKRTRPLNRQSGTGSRFHWAFLLRFHSATMGTRWRGRTKTVNRRSGLCPAFFLFYHMGLSFRKVLIGTCSGVKKGIDPLLNAYPFGLGTPSLFSSV